MIFRRIPSFATFVIVSRVIIVIVIAMTKHPFVPHLRTQLLVRVAPFSSSLPNLERQRERGSWKISSYRHCSKETGLCGNPEWAGSSLPCRKPSEFKKNVQHLRAVDRCQDNAAPTEVVVLISFHCPPVLSTLPRAHTQLGDSLRFIILQQLAEAVDPGVVQVSRRAGVPQFGGWGDHLHRPRMHSDKVSSTRTSANRTQSRLGAG